MSGMKKILVIAVPNARSNKVIELTDNVLKVKVTAPPIDGRANDMLVKLIAKHFKVHRSAVTLLKGLAGRKKIFAIAND